MNENRSAVNVEPRRVCLLAAVSLVFSFHLFPQAFAQSVLLIDKLERQDLLLAKKEVAFSALLEGTVSDPDLAVFVLVHQPRLGGWRIFPATTDGRNRETNGGYRWRAICHFGEFDGRGVGDSHQIKAVAVDRARIGTGNLPLQFGSLIPAIDEARARGVPVLVVSQCFRGAVDMGRYAGSSLAAKAGAISGGDMTVEAAIAKLMIGLGRYGTGDDMRAFLTRDVVGERSLDG